MKRVVPWGGAASGDRAALPDDGPAWPSTDAASDEVADLLHAAVVRAGRPGDGRCAPQGRVDAPLCRLGPNGRRDGHRDDDAQVPSPARETCADRTDDEHHQRHTGAAWVGPQGR